MKIVKLPVEYRRYLIEEKHVVYGDYEYWMLLRPSRGLAGVLGTSAATSKMVTQKR